MNSTFIYAPIHLGFSPWHPTSIQKCANNHNYQDIATVSAIFIQNSTSLHDARNRTFPLTCEKDNHSSSVEHVLRGTPASLCGRYAAEPPPRRACCSAVRPHPMMALRLPRLRKPRSAERVSTASRSLHPASLCAASLRSTHLQYSAVLSAFAPRHPTSLCRSYAYETPPLRSVAPSSTCGRYAYDSQQRRPSCSSGSSHSDLPCAVATRRPSMWPGWPSRLSATVPVTPKIES